MTSSVAVNQRTIKNVFPKRGVELRVACTPSLAKYMPYSIGLQRLRCGRSHDIPMHELGTCSSRSPCRCIRRCPTRLSVQIFRFQTVSFHLRRCIRVGGRRRESSRMSNSRRKLCPILCYKVFLLVLPILSNR